MKNKIMFLSVCLILVWAAGAGAVTPLVELLFNDAYNTQTENLGSLEGTQYLLSTGVKEESGPLNPYLPEDLDLVNGTDNGTSWRAYAYDATPAYSDYSLPELAELTVAFWVYRTQQNNSVDFVASNMFTLTNDDGIQFGAYWDYDQDPGQAPEYRPAAFPVIVNVPQGTDDPNNIQIVPDALPPDAWAHVAITYDSTAGGGSGEGTLYIDGVSVSSIGVVPDWTGPIPAGCKVSISDTTNMFQTIGGQDNFFIFDRVLTQSQVQTLMATNRVPTIPTTCAEVDSYFLSKADVNKDCYVNLKDLDDLIDEWLQCVDPVDPLCDEPWL